MPACIICMIQCLQLHIKCLVQPVKKIYDVQRVCREYELFPEPLQNVCRPAQPSTS